MFLVEIFRKDFDQILVFFYNIRMLVKINLLILFLSILCFSPLSCAQKNLIKNSGKSFYADPAIDLQIIAQSQEIRRGQSGYILFQYNPELYTNIYVEVNGEYKFYPQETAVTNLYLCYFSWPVDETGFRAEMSMELVKSIFISNRIVAIKTTAWEPPTFRLPLNNNFARNKIEELAPGEKMPANPEKQYALLMKEFQKSKAINIIDYTKEIDTNLCFPEALSMQPPVSNARTTSSYGEHRLFTLKKKVVRESYHLGVDLADGKKAEIHAAAAGRTLFTGQNGANGKMILLSHGFGIYTLYGHCSEIFIKTGDTVTAGQIIARSGETGYALGDHLHFSVINQGIYVDPTEWIQGKITVPR